MNGFNPPIIYEKSSSSDLNVGAVKHLPANKKPY
jgi:hypothetical protein